MAVKVSIIDPADPRILDYIGLRDQQLRRQREAPGGDLAGVFIAEGALVVERALRAGFELKSVLIDATRGEPIPDSVPRDVPHYFAGRAVVNEVTGIHLHRGLISVFYRKELPPAEELLAESRRVVILENVTNPTNMGVIVRSAAGLGIDALLLDPRSCDPLYRRALRVAMGEAFSLPHARVGYLPPGLDPARRYGFRIVALTPAAGATPIDEFQASADERVALLLGAEGPGLTRATLDVVEERLTIPMRAGVDSLNVGAAAAIAFYAITRG
ncbi:MAG TPA: RNA methyltransferase [Acidimicrobiia bacterium]|nr:RNA methyltransferase [Acidimicrobiia bacterium]